MHYVKQFNINGVDTRQVACIESKGKPNAATEGCVGALCIDVTSPLHDVYKCVAVNGSIYTWELLSSGLSIVSSSVSGKGADTVQFAYADLRTPLTYLLKSGDLILDAEGYLYQVESINTTYCVGTYLGVNLTASTHTHPATDIDSGTIPIERGGTNANTLDEVKNNLGISYIDRVIEGLMGEGTPTLQFYELDGGTYKCGGNVTETTPNIIIPSTHNGIKVTEIGSFESNDNIKTVIIPNGVTKIGTYAFKGCTNLSSVAIPNSVTQLGLCAFEDCTNLSSVAIPNSVTQILTSAFEGCTNLSSVILPSNLIDLYIGSLSFDNCSPLLFTEYGNCKYMRGGDTPYAVLYKVTDKNMSAYTIHESTKMIGSDAFTFCKNLTSITIPNSVVNINNNAFMACDNLTSIVIGNGVTKIPSAMVMMCPNLTSLTIPNSVTSIGEAAFFDCTALTSINIPSSVTSIDAGAFMGCTNLTKINVGWAEGAVPNAPWGATNATIHYNSEV